MLKRIPGIFFALLSALALTQCVSPLDPDTPRVYTPDAGSDKADTLRAGLVKVRFRMDGALLNVPSLGHIQEWPTLVMKPDSQICVVDTSQRTYRFTLKTQYSKSIDIDSLEFRPENLHIYGVRLHLDSLPLPGGNFGNGQLVHLSNSGSTIGSFIELQVVYTKENAASERMLETVSSLRNDENNDIVLNERTIAFTKVEESENRFYLRLDCILKKTSTGAKFRYLGEITLTAVP